MGTSIQMSAFARTIYQNKYAHGINGTYNGQHGPKEEWEDTAARVAKCVMRPYLPHLEDKVRQLIVERKFMPGGRYLYGAGRPYPQIANCMLFRAHDSREGWRDLMAKSTSSLMTGAGVGAVYSDLREENAYIRGMGGKASGPVALMNMVNEGGRYIRQGGSRRTAIWAGLHWWHKDIFKFIHQKDWPEILRVMKERDLNFPLPMDGTNISVILDDEFFDAYDNAQHEKHELAHRVYWEAVNNMLRTGEPGFSIDIGEHAGENLRNACVEITSKDDSDNCNLGSLNLSRFSGRRGLEEFKEAIHLGIAFLICGTLYGVLPEEQMHKVREKNRRVGLGLMGVHEWLLQRGYRYDENAELGTWLEEYALSGSHANLITNKLGISRSVATRAMAPNGTIAIVAETTSCLEPIPAVGIKRRYLDGDDWKYQYIVDPCAARLIAQGHNPEDIEDAYTLSEDVERRVRFQAWVQRFVDHGISSTINLPPWGSSLNNEDRVKPFGDMLYRYLPDLRGITVYPDGARGGQPLTRVSYSEAIKHLGVEVAENTDMRDLTEANCKTGFCNS